MSELISRIDHVLINVGTGLDEAALQWQRLGFQLTPRGHHSIGSSNHLAVFETDYLELLGFEVRNAHLDTGQWGASPGLAGLVFKTNDADVLAESLKSRNVATLAGGPQPLSRPVDLPNGCIGEARFRTLHLDPDATPDGRIFFCEHGTPELVWRKQWQDHPNGVIGIAGVVIAAVEPEQAVVTLQKLCPGRVTELIGGGFRIALHEARIDILDPETARAQYGTSLPAIDETAKRVALILKAKTLARTEQALNLGDVGYAVSSDLNLVVPSEQASGLALVFEQKR